MYQVCIEQESVPTVTLAPLHVRSLQQTSSINIMEHFFSENRNDVVVIIINEICVGVKGLVGTAAVDLWAVACGVNLGNRQLHRQGVDSVRQWGEAAAW